MSLVLLTRIMTSIQHIQEQIQRGLANLCVHREPKGLYDPLLYMIEMGGKRLRPTIALLSYYLFKKEINNNVLMPALGLELFHAFTLAHDDIMDNADLRRGRVTLHKKWNPNRAILSGDMMCIMAFSYISKCPPALLNTVFSLFSHTATQVLEGQQYDMDYELCQTISHKNYVQMITKKSAVLIACSAKIGALCGGASQEDAELLYDFGLAVGLGFQIRDDYLDAFGDAATFGKTIGGDILNNKKTWLLVELLNRVDKNDQQELNRLLQLYAPPQEKIKGVIDLYNKWGIAQAAENEINQYHKKSVQALESINADKSAKEQIYQYTASLLNRNK